MHTLIDGNEIVIREATVFDAEKLLNTEKTNLEEQEFFLTSVDEFVRTIDEEKERIQSYKEHPKNLLLVAELDNQLIGHLDFKCKTSSKQSHIGEFGIGVLKAFRNNGIGSLLIKNLIDWAKENEDIEKLTLQVFANNHRAIYLYKKYGFEVEGRLIKSVKLNDGSYIDDLLMYRWV